MTVRILQGDCRERLAELPDGSVHCCVTSPPYFGLRDYGTGAWEGGDPDCRHVRLKRGASTIDGGHYQSREIYAETCGQCGAVRVDRQLGLEPTPDEFVAAMVEVFREVRRVLRGDGVLWLNIGDSYAGSWGAQGREHAGKHAPNVSALSANQVKAAHRRASRTGSVEGFGCKPKDLIGIPWRLAFALQADGWFLRQDVIWSKPNPMPESVEDRCTKAHEYLFLLSKSPRYHFDAAAIAEPATRGYAGSEFDVGRTAAHHDARPASRSRGSGNKARKPRPNAPDSHHGAQAGSVPWEGTTRNKRSVWTVGTVPFDLEHCTACWTTFDRAAHGALRREKIMDGDMAVETRVICSCGRHDAWLSHFATFPPDLIEPCILAGCPPGGTVLDPFFGAGTTGLVADRLHRNAIGCELNPHYVAMAEFRLKGDGGLFADVASEAA
jgi:site-specific DNA-methyltransferase (adenine-specific)